ncbi:MAG: putative Ig domain-containing protein [Tetrasphaera sp.]
MPSPWCPDAPARSHGRWWRDPAPSPPGLSLNGASGILSGTPTAAGTKSFKLKPVGAGGKSVTKQFSVKVSAAGAFAITTTSLAAATVGSAYSATLAATGTGATTWTLSAGKPPGPVLARTTGVISGTPTTQASAFFTVKLVRGGATTTQPLSITVAPGAGAVTITTTSLPSGTVGRA